MFSTVPRSPLLGLVVLRTTTLMVSYGYFYSTILAIKNRPEAALIHEMTRSCV